MHTDSVGVAANQPLKCGTKTYITNKSWATVQVPTDPVNGVYKLVLDLREYNPLTHTVDITVKFSNINYTGTLT